MLTAAGSGLRNPVVLPFRASCAEPLLQIVSMSRKLLSERLLRVGRIITACSALLLIGGCIAVGLADPEAGQRERMYGGGSESSTVFSATWWPRVLAGSAMTLVTGCFIWWLGSACRPQLESGSRE
jgi:hypothetical protein